jgi:hypothetical protein
MRLKKGRKKRFKAIMSEIGFADMFHGDAVEDKIANLEDDLLDCFEKNHEAEEEQI